MVRIKSSFYMSHLELLVDTYRAVTVSMNKEAEEASKRLDAIRSDIEELIRGVENYLRKDKITSALELVNTYAKKYLQKPVAEEEKPKSYGNLSENVKKHVAMRQNQREFRPQQIAADLNTRAVSAVYNILKTIPYLKQRKTIISSEFTIFDNTRPKKSKKKI